MTRPLPREDGAIVVVGLGFGDEAKGATVDYLASVIPDTIAVVRWSGGAQAAHNVVHGPRHHTFRQFGSATLLDVGTVLAAPMVVDPLALSVEAEELAALGVRNPLELVIADPLALVTTPFHAELGRARETVRGALRHGSCGMGVGETVAYALAAQGLASGNATYPNVKPESPLRVGDLRDRAATVRALDALARASESVFGSAARLPDVGEVAADLLQVARHLRITGDMNACVAEALDIGTVIFEGSQGVLLDEYAGFHPHTTWATLTPGTLRGLPGPASARDDAMTACGLPRVGLRAVLHGREPYVLGLTRSYSTRHGQGPFPSEDRRQELPEPHNGITYQGAWRQGPLDLTLLQYAARACGVDGVALSHLDQFPGTVARWTTPPPASPVQCDVREENAAAARAAQTVRIPVANAADVLGYVEVAAGAPVVVISDGPARTDRTLVGEEVPS